MQNAGEQWGWLVFAVPQLHPQHVHQACPGNMEYLHLCVGICSNKLLLKTLFVKGWLVPFNFISAVLLQYTSTSIFSSHFRHYLLFLHLPFPKRTFIKNTSLKLQSHFSFISARAIPPTAQLSIPVNAEVTNECILQQHFRPFPHNAHCKWGVIYLQNCPENIILLAI